MQNVIKNLEKELYELYDDGVSLNCRFYKKQLKIYVDTFKKYTENIELLKLKNDIVDKCGLTKREAHLINILSENGYIIILSYRCIEAKIKQRTGENIGIINKYTWIGLCESKGLIVNKVIGNTNHQINIIYLHPDIIMKYYKM